MRYRTEGTPNAWQGVGVEGSGQNRRPNSAILPTACYCGGPGGRPGQAPICLACARTDRWMGYVERRMAMRCAV